MTFVVRLSYESDAATPAGAAQDFVEMLRDGDVGDLLFQVIDDNEELCYVQPDTGRVMDAVEMLTDLQEWFDVGGTAPFS